MTAQTMVRQEVSVVKASIWEVALSHIAKEAFNRIRAANVAVQNFRKRIIRQKMFFIFTEAADGFGVALLVFGG